MSKLKLTILTFLILALGTAVSACVKKSIVNTNQNQNTNTVTTTEEIDTSDWKTYRNEEYGFEFKYPEDFKIIKEDKDNIWFDLKFESINDSRIKFRFSNLAQGFEDAKNIRSVIISGKKYQLSVSNRKNYSEYQVILDKGFYITYDFIDDISEKLFNPIIKNIILK